MNEIQALTEIDFTNLLLSFFIILIGFNKIVEIIGKTAKNLGKPIKWLENRETDHDLILANTKAIKDLAELHKKDTETSNEHDEKIRDDLSVFMEEVRNDIKKFTENRVREQSREIQKELNNSIKIIVDSNSIRDTQIDNLMFAQRELLADKINDKYKLYIDIKGIPEDEYDEFVNLHKAYKGTGGNSSGDAKFDYCINHLPVIPVETKLVMKHE